MAPSLGLLVIVHVLRNDHISTNAPSPAVDPSQKDITTDKTNTTTTAANLETVYIKATEKNIIEIVAHY